MVMMKKTTSILFWLFASFAGLSISTAFAIDNPDSPDYVANFKQQADKYKKTVNDSNLGNRQILLAYDDYQTFLDKELNKAYKLLMSKLAKPQQTELKQSQQKWIAFRDAEFVLINSNWTRSNFGSSFALSRGTYRCSIIETRVLQLYHYVKNY